ncbi:MAG: hypothetical protein GF307_04355 [candidate division Zixibacteria bacterium]|nr:hypothetical protein [candidate division Zixibacteria bacterium]
MEYSNEIVEQKPRYSALSRVFNVLWEPAEVFKDIKIKPSWILPWILLSVISILSAQVSWKYIVEHQIDQLRDRPGMTEEQFERVQEQMGDSEGWSTNRIMAIVFTPIGIIIAMLVVAGVLYLTGSVIGGGNANFKENLGVYSHAAVVGIVGAIVNTVLVQARGAFDISLSPELFMPLSMEDTFIYGFLSHFEFFAIWTFVLTSIGFSEIYKFSRTKSYISVGILWLIWIVISEVFSNMFGGMFGV